MTNPYPYPDGDRTPAEDRFLTANVLPYVDADPGDQVAALVGSIEGARYTPKGSLAITIDVPFDMIGDPTELMRSQGRMLVVELFKL